MNTEKYNSKHERENKLKSLKYLQVSWYSVLDLQSWPKKSINYSSNLINCAVSRFFAMAVYNPTQKPDMDNSKNQLAKSKKRKVGEK